MAMAEDDGYTGVDDDGGGDAGDVGDDGDDVDGSEKREVRSEK